MRRFALPLIAVVASTLVCLQNLRFASARFSWAVMHGAGVSSLLAFLQAALALAFLWIGHHVFKKKIRRHTRLAFAAFALGVVVLNEWLLPFTPLKTWIDDRAVKGVRVWNVRDEPLLSARGNPIGVRISFDAVVPRTRAYSISPTTLASASGETIWPLQFGHGISDRIQPAPTAQPYSPYDIFQKDVIYTFILDMLPNFLQVDEKTKTPCLAYVTAKDITEGDFLSALTANRNIGLGAEIQVHGEYSPVTVVAAKGVTSGRYDMLAIYETIAKEGGGRCQ